MQEIPVWRAGRAHTSLDARPLLNYRGEPVAQVHQAPALLVHRAVAELRRHAAAPCEDPAPLWPVIVKAGELLATAELGGVTPAEHAKCVTLATGAPIADTVRSLNELAAAMDGIEGALRWQAPGGDLDALRQGRVLHPGGRGFAWAPVGRVMGFIAPSNHPAVHFTWIMALAMGWSVALRPGADDPLTPWRVALALEAAGFPMDRLAILPGGHDLVPALVEACDRTVAYGGATLETILGHDGRVLFNGPGHSKVLVDAPADPLEPVDFLLECIAHDGGRKCTCASGVLVRGAAPGLADALAARLEAIPLLDPLDPAAQVPAWKDPAAAAATPPGAVTANGLTFVKPGLARSTESTEIPAPWATLAEFPAGADPMPVLRGSLAVTLLTHDRPLIHSCLCEPSILKVFVGKVPPWHTEPGAPHHGRLSEFLFTSKAFREVAWP